MKYFYDITLNFNEYPINYYEWEENDDIERLLKIKVYKVEDIKDYLNYHLKIDLEDDKYVLCDGINAIAIEVIDKCIAFISCLTYEDELNICKMVKRMEITSIKYEKIKKRNLNCELRNNASMKNYLLKYLEESDMYLLKYLYLDITNKDSNDINKIREYLKKDIDVNFDDKYIELYRKIVKKNI